jgi:hypothetical protein
MESNALFTYLAAMPRDNLYGIGLLVVVVLGVGVSTLWERRFGEGTRVQSVGAALVILAIVGFFGFRYMRLAQDAGGTFVGTPIKRYMLGDDRVALIMKRTEVRRVRDEGAASASDDTSAVWELVIRELKTGAEVKRVALMERRGGSLVEPWLRDAGEGRLWVYDGLRVSRVDLRTGEITREAALGAQSAALKPPFKLHPRQPREGSGELAVQDDQGRWWWVKGDLSGAKTTDEAIEGEYLEMRDRERQGCSGEREYTLTGSGERQSVRLEGGRVRHHGKVEAAREGTLLRPEFVYDARRRCIVEVEAGPLVFERASLAHKQATKLALSRVADGEVVWSEELRAVCGASGALRGVYQVGWGAVFVFESGASCGVGADGAARWRRGQREVFELGEVKEAGLFEVTLDGEELELWGASSSGRQLYRAVLSVGDGAVSIKQTL